MRTVLFFSRGVSLDIWQRSGLLVRELAPYKRLLPHTGGICFVTYGGHEDARFASELHPFEVLFNRWHLPTDMFGLLCPLIYRKRLRRASIFKTNQINGWWSAGLAKLLFRKPLIVRCGYLLSLDQKRKRYSRLRTALVSFLERLAFLYADAVVVTTTRMKRQVVETHRIPEGKVRVIPSSVDTALFRPMPEVEKVRGRIGFIGRMSSEKNLSALLKAVSGMEGVSLLLIGDGELRSELEAEASRLEVEAQFPGSISNDRLPEMLNSCQFFVLPSKWEGMPKSLVEAMACGLPVIGADVPGIRDLIDHGRTGYLCEPGPDGIRSAIRSLLADPLLAARLGQEARAFAAGRFALERVVRSELELLTQTSKSFLQRQGKQ